MNKARTGKIGFQGARGANSEIAIREVFPMMEAVPCDTFEDVFNALAAGSVDLAMIPIENTLAGRVADIHHLLPASGTFIIGEHFLPIHFDLMVLPGVKIEDIKTVYSHVHALGQCRKIIRQHGWKAVVGGDTAGSAKFVSEQGDRTIAALAPALAAEIYGLDTLARNVEDAEADPECIDADRVALDEAGGDPGNRFPRRPVDWRIARQRSDAADVVVMMVGDQDGRERQSVLRDKILHRAGVAGVHRHGVATVVHQPDIVVVERG